MAGFDAHGQRLVGRMQAVRHLADKLGVVGPGAGQGIDAAIVDNQARIAVGDDQLFQRHQLVVKQTGVGQQVVDQICAHRLVFNIGDDRHGVAGIGRRLAVEAAIAAQVQAGLRHVGDVGALRQLRVQAQGPSSPTARWASSAPP